MLVTNRDHVQVIQVDQRVPIVESLESNVPVDIVVQPERGTGAAKSEYSFSEQQTWVRTTNRSFSFVDETEDVVNIHAVVTGEPGADDGSANTYLGTPHRHESPQDYLALLSAASSPVPDLLSHSRSSGIKSHASHDALYGRDGIRKQRRHLRPSPNTSSATQDARQNPAKEFHHHDDTSASSGHTGASIQWDLLHLGEDLTLDFPNIQHIFEAIDPQLEDKSTGNDRTYVETPLWPLQDRQEAFLYRYFVDNLAPLFDMCDNDRHFAKVVPKRAVYCPTLLNAMFSASAKRLSRTIGVDGVIADRYHQICLRSLIPALSSSTAVVDDNLLAAVVILRFTEEVDIGSMTLESHLMGTRILLAAQENAADFSGLRLSAFWLALRQEIYMAFVHTRPVYHSFFPSIKRIQERGNSDENAVDCHYANKAVSICAMCLSYCYGQEDNHVRSYAQLKEDLDVWWKEKPWYFDAMWANPEPGFLLEEQYITDAAVAGLQHYHLARMLLIAHNPKVARLGTAFRAMEEELKQTVRVICGLAVANERTPPAYVNACIAITMAGDRFTDRKEQEELYKILVKTDRRLGWPTHAAQSQIREAWGWEDSPSPPAMPIAAMLNARARAGTAD
ncbi:hypothetical protein CABS01_06249 [Colletotrichum abscissum]|uniref:Arca-like protein n=1 Tax=Colletotrichum limetticola TaxID=1209924 RepID=A0ABQ9PZ19_9PEZI|nr:uncharacterized protein CABS01_06249 [Colletotrichum abscissum]KAK0376782.1 hypothetical protein CLIM01_05846 [Colletotrichum limetticola]KAK1516282.1 hypothetical protein CABS01_06249 [Colletotrichum abscissum]